jgi:hypothetical protein
MTPTMRTLLLLSGGSAAAAPSILDSALIRISAQTVSGQADGSDVTSIANAGTGGATYDASSVSGSPPLKQTVSGNTVMQFGTSANKSLQLANSFDVSANGSIFMVADQIGTRCIAWGGAGASSSFFGYGANDGSSVLFRRADDNGLTINSLAAVAGLKVFGMVIGASVGTITYYDNSTTGVGTSTGFTANYIFQKIGARDAGGTDSQPSNAYIAEAMYFDSALSPADAADIVTALKTLYGIA